MAMLPTYMRSGVKPNGPLPQVNPLRIGASNALTGQPMFGALSSANTNEGETNIFTALKATKKLEEAAVEKIEVCLNCKVRLDNAV